MLAIVTTLAMSSCNPFGGNCEAKRDSQDSTIPAIEDSIKEHIIKQDSLYKGLVEQVEILTVSLNASKTQVAELQQQVESLDKPGWIWPALTILALLLGGFAFFETVASRGAYLRKEDIQQLINKTINHEKQSLPFVEYIRSIASPVLKSNAANHSNGDIMTGVSKRFASIEKQIEELKTTARQPEGSVGTGNEGSRNLLKTFYAKLNTNEYFMTVQEYPGDGCVFRIESNTSGSGKFSTLSP